MSLSKGGDIQEWDSVHHDYSKGKVNSQAEVGYTRGHNDKGHDEVHIYPNMWSKCRMGIREYAAEFIGVMILLIFGDGVICQVGLSTDVDVASSPRGVCAIA